MHLWILIGSLIASCTSSPSPKAGPGDDDPPPDGNSPDSDNTPPDSQPPDNSGTTSVTGVGPYFTRPMFWNRDVTDAPKATNSDAILASLQAAGGWGTGRMQIDFALDVLKADSTTPTRTFTTTSEFYSPDCDHVPVPVPANGNIEDESGYACNGDGDCHLIVFEQTSRTLYEMWRADIASTFRGGCLAVWRASQAYGDELRGNGCTSADAAGFPIAPLLFTADEVAAGHIDHAIRFILPNNRVKRGFVRPATHATSTTGGTNAPPYGVHLRLRADYPIDALPTAGARVVARAMQRYGLYHADGGNIALTAQSDRHTAAKWSGLLGPSDLSALKVSDFEVIDHGALFPLNDNCTRTP
jgi:serine/threonine-protein kinase